jgi:hypothetical protein
MGVLKNRRLARGKLYGPRKDIQEAINQAILATDYEPPLPSLDVGTWNTAFNWRRNRARNDIIEWMGDR